MSRNDVMVTLVGWAATKPKEAVGGVPFTSFRLAETPRYYDSRTGGWTDGRTEWFTVKVFRDQALNVASSISKGDPVVVYGKLRTEEWQGEAGVRTTVVVEAVALGHDLTRGRSVFARTYRTAAPEDAEGADAAPDAVAALAAAGPDPAADPWALDAAEPGAQAPGGARDGAEGEDDDAPQVVEALTP